MDTVAKHSHSFEPKAWPFREPDNLACFTSAQVLNDGHPILMVFHDHEGEWQFVHGSVGEHDECKIICLGCVFEHDESIALLAELPVGWCAYRDSVAAQWQTEPYGNSDES